MPFLFKQCVRGGRNEKSHDDMITILNFVEISGPNVDDIKRTMEIDAAIDAP